MKDALSKIHAEHGALTPRLVVEAASAPSHPLHDRFEWDDAVAGHKYRLVQAQQLIRSVRVTEISGDAGVTRVRAFLSVPTENGPSYVPTDQVRQDPFLARLALQQYERRWRELHAEAGHLAEFLDLVRRDLAG